VTAIPHRIRVSDDARYLTVGQVRERFGVSDMWVWRHMRHHGFPSPIQFGGPTSARHWLLADIEQWERSRTVTSRARRIKVVNLDGSKVDDEVELKRVFNQQQT
jgi:predicted DNA-binding transcriptional regulator AlpA